MSQYITQYPGLTSLYSTRQIEQMAKDKRILINNKAAAGNSKVNDGDTILLDGKHVTENKETVYLVFNKPVGVTCTTEDDIKNNIIKYINYPERIFPVGRLDKDSEGLILLTNDGSVVNKIIHADNEHEKEYIVTLKQPVKNRFIIPELASGVDILNTKTRPCKVTMIEPTILNIVLTQGLNRQIRRMCEAVELEVQSLKRVRIMNINLGDLPVGQWRPLNEAEKKELFKIIGK